MCFLSDRFQVENPETILCKFQFNCGIYSSQMSTLRVSRFKKMNRRGTWNAQQNAVLSWLNLMLFRLPQASARPSLFKRRMLLLSAYIGYISSSVLDSERSLHSQPPASDLQPRHIICTIWFLYHYLVFLNGYQTRNLFLFQLPGFLPVLHGFH